MSMERLNEQVAPVKLNLASLDPQFNPFSLSHPTIQKNDRSVKPHFLKTDLHVKWLLYEVGQLISFGCQRLDFFRHRKTIQR